MIFAPKVVQNGFSLCLLQKRKSAAKTRFGRKSAEFPEKCVFGCPEAQRSPPSREPTCRPCFLWCFGAPFHPFRIFSLQICFFASKAVWRQKGGFGRKKAFFCVLGGIFGPFPHPCANLPVDHAFFGVLSAFLEF